MRSAAITLAALAIACGLAGCSTPEAQSEAAPVSSAAPATTTSELEAQPVPSAPASNGAMNLVQAQEYYVDTVCPLVRRYWRLDNFGMDLPSVKFGGRDDPQARRDYPRSVRRLIEPTTEALYSPPGSWPSSDVEEAVRFLADVLEGEIPVLDQLSRTKDKDEWVTLFMGVSQDPWTDYPGSNAEGALGLEPFPCGVNPAILEMTQQ